jgi:hypothetical protein
MPNDHGRASDVQTTPGRPGGQKAYPQFPSAVRSASIVDTSYLVNDLFVLLTLFHVRRMLATMSALPRALAFPYGLA